MAQVFVSYSSKETDFAYEFVHKLEQKGITCWIAPRDIPVGSDYTDKIPVAINGCPTFLLLMSKNSMESKWVKRELNQALSNDQYVLPLQIEDCTLNDSFAFLLQNIQIRPYFLNPHNTFLEILSSINIISESFNQKDCSSQVKSSEDLFKKYEKYEWLITIPEMNVNNFDDDTIKEVKAELCYHNASELYRCGDYTKALYMYQEAASLGHARAKYKVGHCFHTGKGTKPNIETAIRWYKRAAIQGDAQAQNLLALCYQFGDGVPQDFSQAIKWYKRAMNQGWVPAKKSLERLLRQIQPIEHPEKDNT